ncbi:hypothetical protein AOQ84DRAFT_225135 [Glonium stellatum]|uniref:Uncharacterized protein n=1 Tax=Glonium stellatum TaxID=574774 RepID=A0A8E2EV30_9PEZI|nr:hypothetical protein AOQ84DRAFT_225135 [Glonium stellatum]
MYMAVVDALCQDTSIDELPDISIWNRASRFDMNQYEYLFPVDNHDMKGEYDEPSFMCGLTWGSALVWWLDSTRTQAAAATLLLNRRMAKYAQKIPQVTVLQQILRLPRDWAIKEWRETIEGLLPSAGASNTPNNFDRHSSNYSLPITLLWHCHHPRINP